MIATCGPLNPPLSRNASPSWNWLHSTSSPRSRPFGSGRPSIASTVAISVSATWTTLDRRMLQTTGVRQYRPGTKRGRLRPDLAMSGDDLSGRHLPSAKPLDQDTDLAGTDQIQALQEKHEGHNEREPGHNHDDLSDIEHVCHPLPPIHNMPSRRHQP